MKRFLCLALFALILLPTAALAAPTAEEVKSVLDHYNSGSEVILVESMFCSEISREGENKNDCVDTLNPATLNKGDKVYLWMNYMVPKETTPKILVQFNKEGRTMKTRDINLSGSFRYRTWSLVPTNKAGAWTVAIDQESGDDFTAIASVTYNVSDLTK